MPPGLPEFQGLLHGSEWRERCSSTVEKGHDGRSGPKNIHHEPHIRRRKRFSRREHDIDAFHGLFLSPQRAALFTTTMPDATLRTGLQTTFSRNASSFRALPPYPAP
jgi:hypothetical protein